MKSRFKNLFKSFIGNHKAEVKEQAVPTDINKLIHPVFAVLSKSTFVLIVIFFGFAICDIHEVSLINNVNTVSIISIFILLTMYAISLEKRRGVQAGSLILFSIYFIGSIYSSINWGIGLSMSLLGFALVIMLSSILVSVRLSIILGTIVCLSILCIGIMQVTDLIDPNLEWRNKELSWNDPIQITVVFLLIVLIAWSTNRKKEKLFKQTLTLTEKLKIERDTLDARVIEKTKELLKVEQDKISNLHKFIELGKMTSSLIHDLSQPLTTLNVHLSTIDPIEIGKDKDTRRSITRARTISNNINELVSSLRKQLRGTEEKQILNLKEEIESIINLLEEKIRETQAKIAIKIHGQINCFAPRSMLRQIIVNLIDNSLNAVSRTSSKSRNIIIQIEKARDSIQIIVSDSGGGIDESDKDSIFNPFFTKNTKEGVGLGLASAKSIAEKNLEGTLNLIPRPKNINLNSGATFELKFPSNID